MADFDFNAAEEEELQYKTFWERLRESFGRHLSNLLNIHKIHSKVQRLLILESTNILSSHNAHWSTMSNN